MYSSQIIKVVAAALLFVFFSSSALSNPSPQAIDMRGGKLIPIIKITEKYDDNIFSQNDDLFDLTSSWITQLQPVIQFLSEKDANYLAITYTGDYGFYHDSRDDDYADHTLSINARLSPTDLYLVDFGVSTGHLHENRGEGSSEGVNAETRPEPDEYDIDNVNLLLDFGRDTARFGFTGTASHTNIDYTTNRSDTQFRDKRQTEFGGRFYGRVGGRTTFFVEAGRTEFRYKTDPPLNPSIDSDNNVYYVGVAWEATGRTTGSIKIGQLDKDFDADELDDGDINVWDVDIIWSPRTYSSFAFSTSKDAHESNGTGTFIEAQNTSLAWLHSWSDRTSTTVSAAFGKDEFDRSTREDDLETYSIGINYDWRRWLTVGASYAYADRDSNVDAFSFDRQLFSITFDLSL